MTLSIPSIPSIGTIQPDRLAPTRAPAGGSSFSDVLTNAISEVESSRSDANRAVEQFLAGDGDDLHSTILASQRAELEFQMFLQMRNKVVSAYQEIMKMQM